VPDPKTLDTILAQPIAKPLAVSFPITPDFRGHYSIYLNSILYIYGFCLDLFASLVPIALNNALAAFSSKRAEIMNIEINRLRESTNILNSYVFI